MATYNYIPSDFHHSSLTTDEGEGAITSITPRIFISNWTNAIDEKCLAAKKIGAVLHLGDVDKTAEILKRYSDAKIEHKTIIIEDKLREKFNDKFQDIWDYISAQHALGKIVLVHCSNGNCRAPTAVLYYMVRKMFTNPEKPTKPVTDKLLGQLKSLRPCIILNKDFIDQIRAYEAGLLGLSFVPVVSDAKYLFSESSA